MTGDGGIFVSILREVVEPSQSSSPETDAVLDAISESSGSGGMPEFPRSGEPGVLKGVDGRCDSSSTRERSRAFWEVGGDDMGVGGVKARGNGQNQEEV